MYVINFIFLSQHLRTGSSTLSAVCMSVDFPQRKTSESLMRQQNTHFFIKGSKK